MEPFDTKHASLTYLTNPIYQQILKQQPQATVCNNKSDIKFYRKRITALTKDMLKGEIPENSYIKTIYETYVTGLIKYFKMVDTTDIIQQQYLKADDIEQNATEQNADATEQNEILTNKEITTVNMNNQLMRKHSTIATLDNFVIKLPNETSDTRIIPLIIDVDLKEPSLKKKGVKDKKEKKNKQSK
jgi:hypothetical protein